MSYCKYINSLNPGEYNVHREYHDNYYGFPIHDDNELFCRLVLEINQAGLSWTTILNKQQSFRKAYHGFEIKKVAAYKEKDVKRLMNDAGIIRNRLKINAAIENAKTNHSTAERIQFIRKLVRPSLPKNKRGLDQTIQANIPIYRRRNSK